ncbi:hypothetical protein ABGB12_15190 [Actinocorallia sp. B10E7]|uniref:hypothetical protein n=1 Tax=Actinocorallia sp. B10E7 TaxID=3153558 RepID=UPI00325C4602
MTFSSSHDVDPRSTSAARPGPFTESPAARLVWALTRLSIGWVFLWAFLDKTFGLGHETPEANAWLEGGHPTEGFLSKAAKGPFQSFYNSLAGYTIIDWIFMVGLLGIGVALILGIAMRVAAGAGALMLVMMWSAVLPPENNIFMDDHLVYALVLIGLALVHAGDTLGLGAWWSRLGLVRKFPVLR